MTTPERAERAVRWLLEGIHDMEYLDHRMPHGFELDALDFEERVNPFAPSLRQWRVTATAKVPVIWSADNGRAVVPPTATTSRSSGDSSRATHPTRPPAA